MPVLDKDFTIPAAQWRNSNDRIAFNQCLKQLAEIGAVVSVDPEEYQKMAASSKTQARRYIKVFTRHN